MLISYLHKIHARLGELQYMAATAGGANEASSQAYMAEALKRFCRSIELCDDYLRGYYGLKLVCLTRRRFRFGTVKRSCGALLSNRLTCAVGYDAPAERARQGKQSDGSGSIHPAGDRHRGAARRDGH